MLFNSFAFAIFLPIVLIVYYVLSWRVRYQNYWLIAVSYFFYGWWDWRFLVLLAGMTVVAYVSADNIYSANTSRIKKSWLLGAIVVNLGALGFFKYFDFFIVNFSNLFSTFFFEVKPSLLGLALPVGISFFAFQGLSYVIDVYRGVAQPAMSFSEFAVFKSFFPQLVAGPIERANHMLPQFRNTRQVTPYQLMSGVQLILWGLYKKTVIADNLSGLSNTVFNAYSTQSGADLVLGMLAFTFQIYCDFSGYSDIARGTGRLMGFELVVNFSRPYFSLNPSEFWRRWHISLSQWLRDYVYISLGGNRLGRLLTARNLMLTMVLGGFWHGAAWNYVAWGAYHGALLCLYHFLLPLFSMPAFFHYFRVGSFVRWVCMFFLTVIGWVFFRGESIEQIFYMFSHIGMDPSSLTVNYGMVLLWCVVPLMFAEAVAEFKPNFLDWHLRSPVLLGVTNAILVILMLIFASREPVEFIYFDF